jgi:hypothetical protein
MPDFALTRTMSSSGIWSVSMMSNATWSASAFGKSILLITGITRNPSAVALSKFDNVCA